MQGNEREARRDARAVENAKVQGQGWTSTPNRPPLYRPIHRLTFCLTYPYQMAEMRAKFTAPGSLSAMFSTSPHIINTVPHLSLSPNKHPSWQTDSMHPHAIVGDRDLPVMLAVETLQGQGLGLAQGNTHAPGQGRLVSPTPGSTRPGTGTDIHTRQMVSSSSRPSSRPVSRQGLAQGLAHTEIPTPGQGLVSSPSSHPSSRPVSRLMAMAHLVDRVTASGTAPRYPPSPPPLPHTPSYFFVIPSSSLFDTNTMIYHLPSVVCCCHMSISYAILPHHLQFTSSIDIFRQ